jgi:flavin-dependent dehydrogenase
MSGRNVAIVGAGVAGSILAYILYREGFKDIHVYDMCIRYRKPCGESVPAWVIDDILEKNSIPIPEKLNNIMKIIFLDHDGKVLNGCESSKPIWYIIDKSGWVERLRANVPLEVKPVRHIKGLCSTYDLVVDARGPFGSQGGKVVAWRAYVRNILGLRDEAIIILDWRYGPGLIWLFPYGKSYLNVGGGFNGVKDPKGLTLKTLMKLYGIGFRDIEAEAYSLVTVKPKLRLWEKPCIMRVGEAAGLVMALGGEGIRPAIISSIAAVKALLANNDKLCLNDIKRLYFKELRRLSAQARFQKRLLSFAGVLGVKTVYKLLSKASQDLLCMWLRGDLVSMWQVVKGLIFKYP